MKKKNKFWFYPLVLSAFVLLLTSNCSNSDKDLSPARDVTGTWEGRLIYSDNTEGGWFLTNSDMKLVLIQDGDDVSGTLYLTSKSITNIPSGWPTPTVGNTLIGSFTGGTISGVNINWEVNISNGCVNFKGTFTSSTMVGMKNAADPPMISCGQEVNENANEGGVKGVEWQVYKK